MCEEVKEHSFIVFEGIKNNSLQKAFKEKKFKYKLNINICIVLHLYIYVALLAVHTNQKRFDLHLGEQMQWYCRAIVCEELAQGSYIISVSHEGWTRTVRITGRAL